MPVSWRPPPPDDEASIEARDRDPRPLPTEVNPFDLNMELVTEPGTEIWERSGGSGEKSEEGM